MRYVFTRLTHQSNQVSRKRFNDQRLAVDDLSEWLTMRSMQSKNEMRPLEFIVLVACIMLLTALAIDIMLPAFNDLRDYFALGPESTATAQIVTFFFLGQIG